MRGRALGGLVAATVAAWAPASPGNAQQTVHEGAVRGALLLGNGTVAIAEDDRVLFLAPSGARAATIDGPFARVSRIVRGPERGLVVWDDSLWTAFAFADDGGERGAVRFPRPGLGGGEVEFLALLPGETGLFEEVDIGNPFALLAGGSPRFPVRYLAQAADGSRNELWVGRGRERSMHRYANGMASGPVIFGYGVLAGGLDGGRGFVVAQTEGEEAVVLAEDGARIAALRTPPQEAAVTEAEVEARRARLIATAGPSEDEERLNREMASLLRDRMSEDRLKEMFEGMEAARIEAIRNAPANPLPPRITSLTADLDGRVWMRRFARPGEGIATWDMHSIDGDESRSVQLPATWTVLDAADARILAAVTDDSGAVVRVVVSELPPPAA